MSSLFKLYRSLGSNTIRATLPASYGQLELLAAAMNRNRSAIASRKDRSAARRRNQRSASPSLSATTVHACQRSAGRRPGTAAAHYIARSLATCVRWPSSMDAPPARLRLAGVAFSHSCHSSRCSSLILSHKYGKIDSMAS
jgi:hypothetical protein